MRNKIVKYLGSPKIFTFAIMWLIVLVFVGTIMQKYDGLYIVQNEYFTNWIKWFGYIPVPSAKTTMAIMFVNLSTYFLRKNIWQVKKLGVTITHLGFIFLLFGSALTYIFSYEGNMIIREGNKSNFIENAYKNEFVVSVDSNDSDSLLYITFPDKYLFKNNTLKHELIPFEVKIQDFFVNCSVNPRQVPDSSYSGFLIDFSIDTLGVNIENQYEKNRPGIYYSINSSDNEVSNILRGMPLKHSIENNNIAFDEYKVFNTSNDSTIYRFYLRRERVYVPFEIELIAFDKEEHVGTNTAKRYSSNIRFKNYNTDVVDPNVTISMNVPYRKLGYTIYQASYYDEQTTVFAVVKNYGRVFPYVACIIMSIGILFHLFNMVGKRFKGKRDNG